MFSIFRSKSHLITEDEVYAQAYLELESEEYHCASMARALVKAEGNQEKAIGLYIQERFDSLKAELEQKRNVGETVKITPKSAVKDYRASPTYYDPAYKERTCRNCDVQIPKGKVFCFNCKTLQDHHNV